MAAGLHSLRPVACVAALNAAAQGLVGVVLGVLALCVCFCALGDAPQATGNDLAQYFTYYLQGDACSSTDYALYSGLTGATALRIWMALSLFFSVSMLVSSMALIIAVVKRWPEEKMQIALVSWIFINIFTAIDDLILGYVFSTDYSKSLNDTATASTVGPVALGLVAFLAFRGVYLWLLNLFLIMYLIRGARALHRHINQQMPRGQGSLSSSWPVLEDFGKSKPDIERSTFTTASTTPTAINPRLSDRLENGVVPKFPDHTAMARWPTLNGQPHTMRERSAAAEEDVRERRAKTLRESSFRREEGVDNPGYDAGTPYYLRLQSDTGSTRDFEDREREPQQWELSRDRSWDLPKQQDRDSYQKNQGRGSDQWDLPKNQWELPKNVDHSKREASSGDSTSGQYRPKSNDTWKENTIPPPPSTEYIEENGVPIPPVDYPQDMLLDPQTTSREFQRPLSLQEAILDRTLRLKKVPEQLRKGLK